jgi:hypothetical protein
MTEKEKKPAIAARKKNNRFGHRAGKPRGRSMYKSKAVRLKDDTFDVGASSDPARCSKLLKSNCIQKTY